MSDVIVAPHVRDLGALARDLAAWVAPRLADAGDVRVENLDYPRGAGQSHETILFDLSWTQAGERRTQGLVVRIKPTDHTVYPDDLFEQQWRLMQVLHQDGAVRVAKIFWVEEDPTVLGAPFFVMQKLRGRVAVSVPDYAKVGWVVDATPEQRRKMGEGGVRQLAAIQSVPVSAAPFLADADGRAGLEQEWEKYQRFARWISRDRRWPPLETAMARLERNWPRHQPAGIVWGDARIGNMMFDEAFEVVAVMDWEQPSLGGALHDLAWWLYMAAMREWDADGRPTLDGFLTRDEMVALWRAETGIATDDLDWYLDFTKVKVACLGVRTAELKGWATPTDAEMARRLGV